MMAYFFIDNRNIISDVLSLNTIKLIANLSTLEPVKEIQEEIEERRVLEMLYHGIVQPYQTTAVQNTNCAVELICRTCLKMIGTYFDIFNHKKDNELLVNMLTNCTSVKIQKEDGLPINICTICLERLTSAFDFKTMVIDSDSKLHQLLWQGEGIKREGELCNHNVEDSPTNEEETSIKSEQTTITDPHCKNEDTGGNHANMEKSDIEVGLETELLDENCSSIDDPHESSSNLDPNERQKGETPPVYNLHCQNGKIQNRTRKKERNGKIELSSRSLDNLDKSAILYTNFDDSPKTRRCKMKEQTAPIPKQKNDGEKDEESSRLVQQARSHVKERRTTPATNSHCRNGDILANEAKKEEMEDRVRSQSKTSHGNDVSSDDSVRASLSLRGSAVIKECCNKNETVLTAKKRKVGKKDELPPNLIQGTESPVSEIQTVRAANSHRINQDVLRNEAKTEEIGDKVELEPESMDEDGGFSDDSVPAGSSSEVSSKRRCKTQNQSAPVTREKRKGGKLNNYDEKHAELLDNPDFKRIMSSGLTKKQKDRETVFCVECNKTISFRYFIAIHAYTHTGKITYKCDKCEKRFPKESILRRHVQLHIQTKDFACDVCGKSFPNNTYLRSHKARKHSGERPYKCNLCDKTFTASSGLSNHANTHLKERKYVCETCGKSFVENAILKRHRESHSTEKNFVCITCGKAFTTKRALSWHLKVHRGEKSCICGVCGKGFYYTTLLKKHALIHTGEKPYACHICGKTFRQRGCIGRHMRIHTGETPYPCRLCPCSFKYSHHLLNHMKVHEKEPVRKEEERLSDDDPLVPDC